MNEDTLIDTLLEIMTPQKLLELNKEMVLKGKIGIKEIEVNEKESRKAYVEALKNSDYEFKDRICFDTGYIAYRYILENGGEALEALIYACKEMGKDEEFAIEARHRRYMGDGTASKIVEANDTHPQQKLMKENGTLSRDSLKKSSTPNQQLNNLSKNVNLSNTLEELKENDETQKAQITKLEAKDIIQANDIDKLQGFVGIDKTPWDVTGKLLKERGYTQKEVSELVNKSLSTIKRHWKKW